MDRVKLIVDHFGYLHQKLKSIEELSELSRAIAREIIMKDPQCDENVVEEIADATIMIEQLKVIYCIDEFKLNAIIDSKIKRTLKIMEKQKCS